MDAPAPLPVMLANAAGILSAAQLAALDGMLKRERDLTLAQSDLYRLETQADQPEN